MERVSSSEPPGAHRFKTAQRSDDTGVMQDYTDELSSLGTPGVFFAALRDFPPA